MQSYYLTDDQFIEEWHKIGSPEIFAKTHKLGVRSVYNRRRSIESRLKLNFQLSMTLVILLLKTTTNPGHARRGIEWKRVVL